MVQAVSVASMVQEGFGGFEDIFSGFSSQGFLLAIKHSIEDGGHSISVNLTFEEAIFGTEKEVKPIVKQAVVLVTDLVLSLEPIRLPMDACHGSGDISVDTQTLGMMRHGGTVMSVMVVGKIKDPCTTCHGAES